MSSKNQCLETKLIRRLLIDMPDILKFFLFLMFYFVKKFLKLIEFFITKIMSFIDKTVQENSDIASSYIAGRSVENRLLKVIVLKTSKTSKKSLWIGKKILKSVKK